MRPKIKLRLPVSDSEVAALAARGRWSALPAEPSLHDVACIIDTLDGYGLSDEHLRRDPLEVARCLVERHGVSGIWGGTMVELLAAFYGEVRGWRGLNHAPANDEHRRALGLFGAILTRLKNFPDEVEFIPAPKTVATSVRTSTTHPLVIGWVQAPAGWRVGVTIAPGKTSVSNEGFRWARVLGEDLDNLVGQGVRTLVCLLESDEMARLGIPDLVAAGRHRGLDVIHAPIEDVSVPSMEAANELVAQLLRRKGEAIVIHCNGGLGRSGVVAGCLLRALEIPARDVQSRLEAARGPQCPQTSEQRAFIAQFSYVPPVHASVAIADNPQRDPRTTTRIVGSLLGGAVGDALGAPVEFSSITEIRRRFGADGIREYAAAYGRVGAITDDTQMTLFTAEGLIRANVRATLKGICDPPSVILHAYLRWLRTQDEVSSHPLFSGKFDGWLISERGLWSQRAPGATCLSALKNASANDLIARNSSKGCGGIMRVAPIGLLVGAGSRESGWPAFSLAVDTSSMTHGHSAGYLSAGYFAELVAQLMTGTPLREAIDLARAPLELRPDADDVLLAIDRALRLGEDDDAPTPEKLEGLGGGWVADEALAIALYCALAARDFEHGIRLAVNHTGDSDSTGSLVGNLLGAIWGVDAIPKRWLEELELRGVIETVALDLAAIRTGTFDAEKEWERYPGW